jgi:hypothetical protein
MTSDYAQLILDQLKQQYELVSYYEHYSHDGYDRYGPESDLMTLFVQIKGADSNSPYEYHEYYTENWYKGEEVAYELVGCFSSPVSITVSTNEVDYCDEYSYDPQGCYEMHRKLWDLVRQVETYGNKWVPEMGISEEQFQLLTVN